MGFSIDHVNTIYKNNWRHDNIRGMSRIAVLFPNELLQDGGAFKSEVKFPVMTEASLQDNWNQTTGFKETDATEKMVTLKLEKNFTIYTKIAKVNVPASWETWASNKVTIVNRQEAKEVDDFVLDKIATGVKNSIVGETITKTNFIKWIKKLEKEADKHKFKLQDTIIFVSSDVMVAIIESKLESVNQNIENTSIQITKILNKYSIVEANVDDYGYQMIAVIPTSFAWAKAVETPLISGEYTQGPFFGQIFTVINEFYNGEIIMDEHVLGLKAPAEKVDIVTDKSTSTVVEGADDTVKVTNVAATGAITAKSSAEATATATVNGGDIKIHGVKAGTANVELTAPNMTKEATVAVTVTASDQGSKNNNQSQKTEMTKKSKNASLDAFKNLTWTKLVEAYSNNPEFADLATKYEMKFAKAKTNEAIINLQKEIEEKLK